MCVPRTAESIELDCDEQGEKWKEKSEIGQEPDPEGLIGYGNEFALYAKYDEKAVRTFPIPMV